MSDSRSPAHDAFPTTHRTWIVETLRGAFQSKEPGARERAMTELRQHVMQRYFEPLRIYVKGSSFRAMGESADLVNGFFASRLARDEYMAKWVESGLPLRRWLANGLVLYLRERSREGRIGGKSVEVRDPADLETLDIPALHEPDAAMAMERSWAESVVAGALRSTLAGLEQSRRQPAWEVFQRHFVQGTNYEVIATETGRTLLDLKADAKLVQRRLRAEVERILREDGVPESRLEEETDHLLAMLMGD
jgi:DNA-directed RNA polymerase specialized sigma24 family protein